MGRQHVLVIEGHPDDDDGRFNHALAEAYRAGAAEAGRKVRTVRLAALDFPLLRSRRDWEQDAPKAIRAVQEDIAWADHLVLFYPLWLGDVPAKLKAFLEQALRPDFAFSYSGSRAVGRLKGKSARLIVTTGMPGWLYRTFFGAHSLRSLQNLTLWFCGIRPVRATLLGGVESATEAKRAHWLADMKRLGSKGG